MKVTLSRRPKEPEITYPCLLEASNMAGRIVLFTAPNRGTVISEFADKGYYKVGEYQNCWDMEHFRPYRGAVILENG